MGTSMATRSSMTWDGTIRLAVDADGPAIGKLFAETGLNDLGIDWAEAKPGGWWIVGERHGHILGAIQVAAGRPYGFVGDTVVHPSEQNRRGDIRGLATGSLALALYAWAFEVIRRNGGVIAIGVTNDTRVRALLTRYGGQALGEFTMFAKKLV